MVLMLDIARLTSSLAEAFPEHQAQKLVAVISEALQSVFESEVVRRLDELIEASLRHDAQIAENTRAIERLIRVTEQQSEQIAENTRAIAELRASVERLARTAERHERRLENLERQMGGLSATVGYTLENTAYKALPVLLARDYGIQVQGKLTRDYVVAPDGSAYEVNILGTGVQNGRTVTIVGESKVQLSVQEVDRFLRRKLKPLQSLVENPFPVLVAHMVTSPKVLPHARAKGVAVYLSYEFD